ncbi:MAG: HAD family hydrolase [Candidatus Coprovivens sp.]
MIKRVLFDLDRTLIPWLDEWNQMVKKTYNYFDIPYEENEYEKFNKVMLNYERYHKRFNKVEMSRYFKKNLQKDFPDSFVDIWTGYLKELVPERDEKLIKLLEYLSSKYSLVVVSNWFYDQQVRKLEKFGILKYFDEVLTCDMYDKKPKHEMFDKACDVFTKDEIVMVGDTYKTDIKSAMDYGLFSYYLTQTDKKKSKKIQVIKDIYELEKYL